MLTAAGVGPSAQARVDAVAGARERLVGDQVGGRKAQLAPALVAVGDLAAQLERRAEQPVGLGHARRPARSPRMWLEETISPSTSSSGCTVGREALVGRAAARGSPCALWPKRKFSPTETRVGAERADEHVVDELLGRALARTRRRTGSRSAPARPATAISSALRSGVVSSLGVCCGRDDRHRMRVEREHACRSRRSPRGGRGARRRRCRPPRCALGRARRRAGG